MILNKIKIYMYSGLKYLIKKNKKFILIHLGWLFICASIGMDLNVHILETKNQKNILFYFNALRIIL